MMCVGSQQMSDMTHQPMFSNPACYYGTAFLFGVDGIFACLFHWILGQIVGLCRCYCYKLQKIHPTFIAVAIFHPDNSNESLPL